MDTNGQVTDTPPVEQKPAEGTQQPWSSLLP